MLGDLVGSGMGCDREMGARVSMAAVFLGVGSWVGRALWPRYGRAITVRELRRRSSLSDSVPGWQWLLFRAGRQLCSSSTAPAARGASAGSR